MHPNPELLVLIALGEVDTATPAEHHHVASCPICATELAQLSQLVTLGRSTTGVDELHTPAPYVWDRVLAEIARDDVASPVSPVPVSPAPVLPAPVSLVPVSPVEATSSGKVDRPRGTPRGAVRRRLVTAIAAVLVLLVGGAGGFAIARSQQPGTTVLARAQLAATPSWSGSTATAVLRRNADGQRILTLDLTSSRQLNGTQAVWLIDPSQPNSPLPVGLLALGKGIWSVPANVDTARYRLIDVSEEPANDTDTRHSGNSIVRGPLE